MKEAKHKRILGARFQLNEDPTHKPNLWCQKLGNICP